MIGRAAWALLLALLAVIASLAQLDREARRSPGLAGIVPAPMQGFAAERLAQAALSERDAAAAMPTARRLVLARPLPAEHMTLLSLASSLDGDTPRALAALEQATKRGWRDPVAQQVAAQSALLQGQHEAAAQRISALLATGQVPQQSIPLLARLLADPAGQSAFAGQMARPGLWQVNMIPLASEVVPPADLAQTLALALAKGAPLPCDVLATLARQYEGRGERASARLFWPGDC